MLSSIQGKDPYNDQYQTPPITGKDQNDKPKIDPIKHPLAAWEINNWGWKPEDAIKTEKAFDKTFIRECQEILDRHSHMMNNLKPEDANSP